MYTEGAVIQNGERWYRLYRDVGNCRLYRDVGNFSTFYASGLCTNIERISSVCWFIIWALQIHLLVRFLSARLLLQFLKIVIDRKQLL